jgi:ribulose-phosphate 3-epimerase
VTVQIAPSILAADFARLADDVAVVEAAGADLLHVDVMDGHFVPNITIGPPVVRALRRVTKLPLDVHLMIQDPDRYLEAFIEAGAAMVTVHAEILPHLHRTLTQIRKLGAKPGVAINPATPVSVVREVTHEMHHLLVMSVNPGFGGQSFIPHSLDKIREAEALFQSTGSPALIEVDGGVDAGNAAALVEAGVTILVAGVAIFGAANPPEALRGLRRVAEAAR